MKIPLNWYKYLQVSGRNDDDDDGEQCVFQRTENFLPSENETKESLGLLWLWFIKILFKLS